MKLTKLIFALIAFLFSSVLEVIAQNKIELNTVLMNSTFKIQDSKGFLGTVFILGQPKPKKKNPLWASYVLVTANHVLNDMKGDSTTLFLRKQDSIGEFEKFSYKIRIRKNGTPLWVKHDSADVAAMYVTLPSSVKINLLSTTMLVTDETYKKIEIHPGDEFMCLGYPLGQESNEYGFPILRKGILSSYPLVPMKTTKQFLLDVQIFKGNSGGPVYFVQSGRTYGTGMHLETWQFIAGLVSEERLNITKTNTAYKVSVEAQQLGLAVIVPAIFISETIDKLIEK